MNLLTRYSLLLLAVCFASQLSAQQVDSSKVIAPQSVVAKPAPPPPPPKEEEIFRQVERMPRFPGCEGRGSREEVDACAERKLMEFIYKHLTYPQQARENRIEGTCIVHFIVETDGSVTNVGLDAGIGYGCGEEAMRVIKMMKEEGIEWIPQGCRGRPVRVIFKIPIVFELLN